MTCPPNQQNKSQSIIIKQKSKDMRTVRERSLCGSHLFIPNPALRLRRKGASFSAAARWHSRCSRSMFFRVALCRRDADRRPCERSGTRRVSPCYGLVRLPCVDREACVCLELRRPKFGCIIDNPSGARSVCVRLVLNQSCSLQLQACDTHKHASIRRQEYSFNDVST